MPAQVREAAVKRISAVLNAQGSPDALRPLPIDATLAALSSACEGGTALRTYAPRVPLLQQARAASSQTGHPDPSFDYATEDDSYDRELHAVSWQESESLQWAPTFCGQTAEDQEKFWPKIRESGWSDFCCAHFIPPPMREPCSGHGARRLTAPRARGSERAAAGGARRHLLAAARCPV